MRFCSLKNEGGHARAGKRRWSSPSRVVELSPTKGIDRLRRRATLKPICKLVEPISKQRDCNWKFQAGNVETSQLDSRTSTRRRAFYEHSCRLRCSRGEPRLEEQFTEINRHLPFHEGLFSSVIESSIRILPRGGSGIKRRLSRRGERGETKRRIAAWLSRKSSCGALPFRENIPEKRASARYLHIFPKSCRNTSKQAKPERE